MFFILKNERTRIFHKTQKILMNWSTCQKKIRTEPKHFVVFQVTFESFFKVSNYSKEPENL